MSMHECQIYFLVLSSFLLFQLLPFCKSIDTITSTRPVRDGEILVSNGESFALGFFSLNHSTNRYVGIWYNKVSERTIVWVANRDHPLINSTGGVLSVDDNGNLVLRDNDQTVIWFTNVSARGTTSNSFGQLLDSGNLVLFRGERDGVGAWQSFDHPTDTSLPNMKMGWDRQTGLNRFLTSWKAGDDPGTGEYLFKMDFVGSTQLFLYRGMTPIWRAGTWTGLGWSGVPEMTGRHLFNGSYVNNQDEVTVVWGLPNASIFSRMIVTDSGIIKRLTWLEGERRWAEIWFAPNDQCDNYNHCGSFGDCDDVSPAGSFQCKCLPGFEPKSTRDWDMRDGSSGCTRKRGVNVCGNGEGFKKMERMKVPDSSTALVDMSLGLKECEEMCLGNCSCLGYASANFSSRGGCLSWYGNMADTKQYYDGGQDLYIRVDAAELAQYPKSKSFNRRLVAVLVILSIAAVVLVLLTAFWFARKKRAKQRQHEVLFNFNTSTSLEGSSTRKKIGENGTNADVCMFDLSVLVAATGNFAIANKLGEGGFGSVFKGQLPNGQEIAVKRLSNSSGQGMEEFKNEVTLIAKLQHRNLVRLLGYCVEKEEKMLVYEYLPNKGLDCFIFVKENAAQLDWRKRFDIILGIVRGLLYLHQDSRLRIIHRDLKASNVLLDAALNPKISDFGMARIFGGDQVEATTRRVVGTYGYMSPEYAMEGMFSIKSDVFSLGVLLLEIISGRKNSSYLHENSVNLIGHVWELWGEGIALNIVDPSMGDSYEDHEVLRCIHVGLLCVQELPGARPTMSEVAFMLCNETTLHSPNQPAFIFKQPNYGADSGSAGVGNISINEATMSVVEAR